MASLCSLFGMFTIMIYVIINVLLTIVFSNQVGIKHWKLSINKHGKLSLNNAQNVFDSLELFVKVKMTRVKRL